MMEKKVFDIRPPQSQKTFSEKEPLLVEKKTSPLKIIKIPKIPKGPRIRGKKILWISVPLILIIIGAVGFRISKAEIEIWPQTETVSFTTEVTVDVSAGVSDFDNYVIAGKIVEQESSISQTFLSTGQTLKKAAGIIRLYNAYTTQSENWLAGTRFVSADGKLFKSKDEITVPGAEMKDGNMVASYVDVPVEAAEEGEDYNIGPSHFSIYVFRGTPRYTKFYGESFETMRGGGQSPQVTQEDLQEAENSLAEKTKEAAIQGLEKKISVDFVFLPDVLETEVLEKYSLAKAGDAKEQFDLGIKAVATTIVFARSDAQSFAKNFTLSRIPAHKLLYLPSLDIEYTPDVVDFELGRIILSLDFSAKIYPDIDLLLLKKGLIGKSSKEANLFLENQTDIISAETKFWPFWVQSVPKGLNKIEIQYPVITD